MINTGYRYLTINFRFKFTREIFSTLLATLIIMLTSAYQASFAAKANDSHYTTAGFFDLHVCNWPNRPLFFMAVFSTYDFNDLASVEIFSPENKKLGEFDFSKYRLVYDNKKREKRVYLKQIDIPEKSPNGWYYSKIHLKNNSTITGKDYVIIEKLPIAQITSPDITKPLPSPPSVIKWKKIPGAAYYQVFIKDVWEAKTIHSSKLLDKPEIKIPTGLLKNGGEYTVQIHARDVNEHQLLGDFNHGSLSKKLTLNIAE